MQLVGGGAYDWEAHGGRARLARRRASGARLGGVNFTRKGGLARTHPLSSAPRITASRGILNIAKLLVNTLTRKRRQHRLVVTGLLYSVLISSDQAVTEKAYELLRAAERDGGVGFSSRFLLCHIQLSDNVLRWRYRPYVLSWYEISVAAGPHCLHTRCSNSCFWWWVVC